MSRGRILVVDDESSVRRFIRVFFEGHGFAVAEAESCTAALRQLGDAVAFDSAIVDYQLGDGTASDILRARVDRHVPVIVLTGNASIDLAVQAIKEGAEHFVTKPVQLDSLLAMVERSVAHDRTRRHTAAIHERAARDQMDPFAGTSSAMRDLERETRCVARTEVPILIRGETGSGKGVLASWIHRASPRAGEPYVDLNCAMLGRELLESQLFGHDKGAFTGAASAKEGLIEAGHRGTFFLDEIGDLDPLVQPKLLKVLEEKKFRRLGDVRERQADVRFIAATHHDLSGMVEEGRFREDLFYRLNTITLFIPPLRSRPEDLPQLAEACLRRISADPRLRLSSAALDLIRDYSWPGNVRELRNVLERAAVLTVGTEIQASTLRLNAERGPAARVRTDSDADHLTLDEMQARHIKRALELEGGSVDRAAVRLAIPRSTLYERLKKLGLRPDSRAR